MDGSVVLCAFTQFTNSSPVLILGIINTLQDKEQQLYMCLVYFELITPWSIFLWFLALETVITSYPSLPHKICSPDQLLKCYFRISIIHIIHLELHLLLQWREGSAVCASGAFGSN